MYHWSYIDVYLPQDLVTNGAQVNICNKYGETPLDKAKPHLREALQGIQHAITLHHPLLARKL
jgi:hypothetical protein